MVGGGLGGGLGVRHPLLMKGFLCRVRKCVSSGVPLAITKDSRRYVYYLDGFGRSPRRQRGWKKDLLPQIHLVLSNSRGCADNDVSSSPES